MSILSPSGLETFNYGTPGWNHVYNRNMDLLENELLKLAALQDVDVTGLTDEDVLIWSSSSSKWIRTARY